jgi:hypothetical protein
MKNKIHRQDAKTPRKNLFLTLLKSKEEFMDSPFAHIKAIQTQELKYLFEFKKSFLASWRLVPHLIKTKRKCGTMLSSLTLFGVKEHGGSDVFPAVFL